MSALTLGDGRVLLEKLSRNPDLLKASTQQRLDWKLLDDGLVSWPHLGVQVTLDARWVLWEELCKQANDEAKAKGFKLDELSPRSKRSLPCGGLKRMDTTVGLCSFSATGAKRTVASPCRRYRL
jgi:hypothetical protein